MTLFEALGQHLAASAALASLVGTKIYWMRAEQAVVRSVIFSRVSGERPNAHYPSSLNKLRSRVQFEAYAETVTLANQISDIVRTELITFPGSTGYTGATRFLCEVAHEQYYPEPINLFCVIFDGLCWHREDA